MEAADAAQRRQNGPSAETLSEGKGGAPEILRRGDTSTQISPPSTDSQTAASFLPLTRCSWAPGPRFASHSNGFSELFFCYLLLVVVVFFWTALLRRPTPFRLSRLRNFFLSTRSFTHTMSRRIVQYDDLDGSNEPDPQPSSSKNPQGSSSQPVRPATGTSRPLVITSTSSPAYQQEDDEGAEEEEEEKEGPPHPDASKKLSYSTKKRLRKKRRELEKLGAEMNTIDGSPNGIAQARALKRQKRGASTIMPEATADESMQSIGDHQNQADHDGVDDEEAEADAYYEAAYGDDGEDPDEYDFGEWDGSFANGVVIPTLSDAANSRGPLQSQIKRPAAPPAVTDNGRVLNDDEVWGQTALSDAWSAAQEELCHFQDPSGSKTADRVVKSALWYDAPTPGSEQAQKARQVSENNKRVRELRLYTQQKQQREMHSQATAVAKEIGSGDDDIATKRLKALQTMRIASLVNGPAKGRSAATKTSPASAASPGWQGGICRTPPSSGIPGNRAWQEACATVAATRSLVADEFAPPASTSMAGAASTGASTNAERESRPPSLPAAVAPAPPPVQTNGPSAPQPVPTPATNSFLAPITAPPPSLQGSPGEDEALQSVCMSWYYAGYYTAIWEMRKKESAKREPSATNGAAAPQ